MRVDLVIVDIVLGGEDGISVMGDIRQPHPTVPLIALSGRGREEVAARLNAAGLRHSVWSLSNHSTTASCLALSGPP